MSFRGDLQADCVGSLPLRDVIAVDPHTVLRAAVAMMRNHSLGCAVIVERGQPPSGIFTERSLINVLVSNASLDSCAISQFTDPSFVMVKASDAIASVWNAVVEKAARYVCVTDDEGRLIGLTGQRGLSEYLADTFARQVAVQRLGSTPWMRQREGA